MEKTTTNYAVEIKKLPNSMMEISGSVPAEVFDGYRNEAIKRIGKDVELPGFRKGHVPEKMLSARIGEASILEEMAELAISRAYAEIIIGEKIDALGRPEVSIIKIAMGNPLEFTLKTAVFPEVKLADYKKIAGKITKKKEIIEVTKEDTEKTVAQVQRMRAQSEATKAGKEFDEKAELPELDDAFVKTLGDYSDVADFMAKLEADIKFQKERDARDKVRVAIMEELVKESAIDLPEIIVDQELHRMEDEFSHEIKRMGMTLEAYSKATSKTHDDMHKEWRPDAEKRAKVQLIASKIAEEERLRPEESEIENEGRILREQYPDANPERVRSYIDMLLTNEKVFKFLESIE
jgi:FKBP-type peptidyl-prolyl cis-trans isomerase (trigger factor)